MIEIIGPALLIGVMLAILAGPLGSFVIWGRMAYFGDTLAHSALLGVGLGVLLQLQGFMGVLLVTLSVALVLSTWQREEDLTQDTLLGVLAHGTLAGGLVLASQLHTVRLDLMGLLFGDLLASSYQDALWIGLGALLVMIVLALLWRPLLNYTINSELAKAEGVPIRRTRTALLLMLALTVAIGMKVVGALLITAMLIVPAASARRLASTPEQMAMMASVLGVLSVLGGIAASAYWDTPTGPSIVLAACFFFIMSLIRIKIRRNDSA